MADPAPDARLLIRDYLDLLGLSSEYEWAVDQLIQHRDQAAVQIDLEQRPAFAARFPGYMELKKAGKAVSVAQWLDYERTALQMMRAAGLPPGFYDQPEDFAKFITGQVSVAELQQRVAQAQEAAISTNADVRNQFADLYGIGPGDLTAYFLDPNVAEPLLRQRFASAQVSAAGVRTGFGALTAPEAEGIVGRGVTEEQAASGLSNLAARTEVFKPYDAGEQTIDRATQLAATFEDNAAAQETIRRQARRRTAAFEAGGGIAASQEGFAVGASRT